MDDTRHKAYGVKSCWIVCIMITIWPTLWLVRHLFGWTDASFYHYYFFLNSFFFVLFRYFFFCIVSFWCLSSSSKMAVQRFYAPMPLEWIYSIHNSFTFILYEYFKVHSSSRIIQKIKHEQWAMNNLNCERH